MRPVQGTIGVSPRSPYAPHTHPFHIPLFLLSDNPHLPHMHIHHMPHYQNLTWPILEASHWMLQRAWCCPLYRLGWHRWKRRVEGVTSSSLDQTSSWRRHARWLRHSPRTEMLSQGLMSQRYWLGDATLMQGSKGLKWQSPNHFLERWMKLNCS